MQRATSLDEALKIYNVDAVIRAKNLFDRSRRIAKDFAPDGYSMTVSPTKLI
jgi:hypothetical protein